MKTHILLLAAAYLNGGAYADAGVTVRVGGEKNEISEERAAEIVRMRRADEVDADADLDEVNDDGLDAETVPKLKELAAAEQIDLAGATTKPNILSAIRAHRAIKAGED